MENPRYGIETHTWGRLHWYGHAWRESDEGARYERWELTHLITQKEADTLNALDGNDPDQPFGAYKAGEECIRFELESEVVEAGVKLLREKFGDDIEIEHGNFVYIENPILPRNISKF